MKTITIEREEHLRLLAAEEALHKIITDIVHPYVDSTKELPTEPARTNLDQHPLVLIGNGLYQRRIMGSEVL